MNPLYPKSNSTEYIRDLIRDDQKRRAQERLETLLLDGLDSDAPIDATSDYIKEKRAELVKRIEGVAKHGQ